LGFLGGSEEQYRQKEELSEEELSEEDK